MTDLLSGKVHYGDCFVGYMREEANSRIVFAYDGAYINGNHPPIAHTLPVRAEPYVSNDGLPPFFDNLVSEGWLEQVQVRLLGKRRVSKFELLLTFGLDCAGAVSVVKSEASDLTHWMNNLECPKERAVLVGRASLSGVQPKLAVVEENGIFRPVKTGELSTHIAKFSSTKHPSMIENEYLTTLAFKALLPDDEVVDLSMGKVEEIDEPALLVKRFDRVGQKRIHFEEFNQLLNSCAETKYNGANKDMAVFIRQWGSDCFGQIGLLYRRIIVGWLLGNTDMHLKNFAMFHTTNGLLLTPSYDQVAAALYHYSTLALLTGDSRRCEIGDIDARHVALLGREFGLSSGAVKGFIEEIKENIEVAQGVVAGVDQFPTTSKNKLITWMGEMGRHLCSN